MHETGYYILATTMWPQEYPGGRGSVRGWVWHPLTTCRLTLKPGAVAASIWDVAAGSWAVAADS